MLYDYNAFVMSRYGSGRTNYSYKTEEDFQDEILDLKRQLARIKEESKSLKVKLRRSEENAARKEKIICTMIDPMKAHLTAKSAKAQNKVSFSHPKKEIMNKSSSLSKTYCQGICSRAYRHTPNSSGILQCGHNSISAVELIGNEKKKKIKSKVTNLGETYMDDKCDSSCDSSKLDLFSYDKQRKNSSDMYLNYPLQIESGEETSDRNVVTTSKKMEVRKKSSKKISNSKVKKNKTTSKTMKPQNENTVIGTLCELYPSSENDDDSFTSSTKEKLKSNQRKIGKMNRAKIHASPTAQDYDFCKKCQLKNLIISENEIDNPAACSVEHLILEEKNSPSSWHNDNKNGINFMNSVVIGNHDTNIVEASEKNNSNRECDYDKFGMYLINEHDEMDEIQISNSNNGCKTLENQKSEMGLKTTQHSKERRASIFRVDIKKKEPKININNVENNDSFQERSNLMVSSSNIIQNEDVHLFKENSSELAPTKQNFSNLDCPTNGSATENAEKNIAILQSLMKSLSVHNIQNHIIESDRKSTPNSILNESLAANSKCNFYHLGTLGNYCKERVNCSRKVLSIEHSNKIDKYLNKRTNFSTSDEFLGVQVNIDEESIIFDIISQVDSGSTIIPPL